LHYKTETVKMADCGVTDSGLNKD